MNFPIIIGHEGAGIVESVGPGVTRFKPGDHVIPSFLSQCKECNICKHENANMCTRSPTTGLMPDGTSRHYVRGQPLYTIACCATLSEYTVVPDISLVKINPKAPLDKVCLLGCGVATGYGSAVNVAQVKSGSTCAVWGLGALGLSVILGCRNSGASKIFAIDINPSKADVAKQLGATDFINPKDLGDITIQDHLKQLTGGNGVDYTFEAIGNMHVFRQAFESSANGYGVTTLIGAPTVGSELSLDPWDLLNGRTVKGNFYGNYKCIDDIPELIEEYLKGKLNFDPMITHHMRLEQINEAFDLLKEGKSIRTILTL